MHTIIIISQGEEADEKLTQRLHNMFPECRIRVVQSPVKPDASTHETHSASSSSPVDDN